MYVFDRIFFFLCNEICTIKHLFVEACIRSISRFMVVFHENGHAFCLLIFWCDIHTDYFKKNIL